MPRDERHPTPLINMSPAGLPGFFFVIIMFLGIWQLLGIYFLVGLAIMSVVAVAAALVIRNWRARHPQDESLLHLDSESSKEKGKHALVA